METRKKVFLYFFLIIVLFIFITIRFGYINITFADSIGLQQYQSQIDSNSVIRFNDLKLNPIESKEYTQVKCLYEQCVAFYATLFDVKVHKDYIKYEDMPKYTPNKVVVKGMSFKVTSIFKQYKYLQISGSKSISFFKPNVK